MAFEETMQAGDFEIHMARRGISRPHCAIGRSEPLCTRGEGGQGHCTRITDKKENQNFLIYKEIQNGVVAKSYMRKGFLLYEEMR